VWLGHGEDPKDNILFKIYDFYLGNSNSNLQRIMGLDLITPMLIKTNSRKSKVHVFFFFMCVTTIIPLILNLLISCSMISLNME